MRTISVSLFPFWVLYWIRTNGDIRFCRPLPSTTQPRGQKLSAINEWTYVSQTMMVNRSFIKCCAPHHQDFYCSRYGIRTRDFAVKGQRLKPLVEPTIFFMWEWRDSNPLNRKATDLQSVPTHHRWRTPKNCCGSCRTRTYDFYLVKVTLWTNWVKDPQK